MPTAHRIAVHIGYHRTGTTWLQNTAFRDHPGLFPFMGTSSFGAVASSPFLREMVFTRESKFDVTRARDAYRTQVETRDVSSTKVVLISAERLSGNAASGGFDALGIARRLRDVLADAKVFWILRHQADAIPSEYKALVRAGWPGSVRSTLFQEPRLRTTGFQLAYWEYDTLASAYARLFGPERIKIIDYGEFARRPRQVLDDLASFLEIDRWNLTDEQLSKRINVSESDRQVRLRQRLNHWRRSELNPYPPLALPNRVVVSLTALRRFVPGGRALFDRDFAQWAEDRYAESNRRLQDEFGVSLTRAESDASHPKTNERKGSSSR